MTPIQLNLHFGLPNDQDLEVFSLLHFEGSENAAFGFEHVETPLKEFQKIWFLELF